MESEVLEKKMNKQVESDISGVSREIIIVFVVVYVCTFTIFSSTLDFRF